MNTKGISPIVGAVILIAAAITIGIIVTTWATEWINTQTSDSDVGCSVDTSYVIDSATFNATGYNGILLLKVTNKGKKPLYGFGVVVDNGTQAVTMNSTHANMNQGGINAGNKLEREKSVYIFADLYTAGYTGFGNSLLTASNVKVTVTNTVCTSVSAKVNELTS